MHFKGLVPFSKRRQEDYSQLTQNCYTCWKRVIQLFVNDLGPHLTPRKSLSMYTVIVHANVAALGGLIFTGFPHVPGVSHMLHTHRFISPLQGLHKKGKDGPTLQVLR